jgi:hypothetical protein
MHTCEVMQVLLHVKEFYLHVFTAVRMTVTRSAARSQSAVQTNLTYDQRLYALIQRTDWLRSSRG